MTPITSSDPPEDELFHLALVYRSPAEYGAAVRAFVQDGLAAGEPIFLAVPQPSAELLCGALDGAADRVRFADMGELGRNPARIIPAVRRFVDDHAGQRLRYVGEPIWPGRTPEEIDECVRHEALINLAFAGAPLTVLCPYDGAGLDAAALAAAERTHPHVVDDGVQRRSTAYAGPIPATVDDRPLSAPPAAATVLPFGAGDLARVRAAVGRHAARAGLDAAAAERLVVAVNEVATNSLRHGGGAGVLRLWRRPAALVCEVRDQGRIADPLAGRRQAQADALGGRGLWLVHQLCDLVEVRSGDAGTTVRMRMRRP